MPQLPMPIQPCTDPRCPIHARGADPERSSMLTCARQVLRAYDRADAIALLAHESPLPDVGADGAILCFQSSPLAVGQSERIELGRPEQTRVASASASSRRIHRFRAERIMLHRTASLASWRVDDLLIGGASQFGPHRRLPAELFGSHVTTSGFGTFDQVPAPLDVALVVTRVGETGGDVLIGGMLGSATYEPHVAGRRQHVDSAVLMTVCEPSYFRPGDRLHVRPDGYLSTVSGHHEGRDGTEVVSFVDHPDVVLTRQAMFSVF